MTTTIANHPRTLGRTGPTVTSPGFGGMGLSGVYGQVDEEAGIEVIRSYLDAGGTLLDTGDFYAAGHNESLVRRALAGRDRGSVVLSVKFGAVLAPGGAMTGFDGRPEFVRHSLTYSLQRLGTDHVDIYRPARLDPDVPIEETVGAIAELVEQGYVRHIGLSEVGAATIRRAAAVAPISDLQIEYSLLSRGIEAEILDTCRELGIGITAYGVLSRGLIGGSRPDDPSRKRMPRFQDENLRHNQALVQRLEEIAAAKEATVAQVAIAWVAAQDDSIVPVVGPRRPDQVASMIDSNRVRLEADDLARIEELVPADAVRGDRYPAQFMGQLDSER
ncbi:MAG TPA: aldo/keto reductase [Microlunatus sp.]|nr:aldo/keto reductase [Microlunatus sp.]